VWYRPKGTASGKNKVEVVGVGAAARYRVGGDGGVDQGWPYTFALRYRGGGAKRLLLHPSEELLFFVDPATTTRMRLAIVFLVGEVIIVHIDVFALALVAVAVADARLLRRDGSATRQRPMVTVEVHELGG
jgi:hypothetical protein